MAHSVVDVVSHDFLSTDLKLLEAEYQKAKLLVQQDTLICEKWGREIEMLFSEEKLHTEKCQNMVLKRKTKKYERDLVELKQKAKQDLKQTVADISGEFKKKIKHMEQKSQKGLEEAESSELRQEVQLLKDQIESLRQEVQDNEALLSQERSSTNETLKQLTTVMDDAKAFQDEAQQAKRENRELRNQLENLQSKYNKTVDELGDLKQELCQLHNVLTSDQEAQTSFIQMVDHSCSMTPSPTSEAATQSSAIATSDASVMATSEDALSPAVPIATADAEIQTDPIVPNGANTKRVDGSVKPILRETADVQVQTDDAVFNSKEAFQTMSKKTPKVNGKKGTNKRANGKTARETDETSAPSRPKRAAPGSRRMKATREEEVGDAHENSLVTEHENESDTDDGFATFVIPRKQSPPKNKDDDKPKKSRKRRGKKGENDSTSGTDQTVSENSKRRGKKDDKTAKENSGGNQTSNSQAPARPSPNESLRQCSASIMAEISSIHNGSKKRRTLYNPKDQSLMVSFLPLKESFANTTVSRGHMNNSAMPPSLSSFMRSFIAPKLKSKSTSA
ncbi:uncharacterized protein LOC116610133 [Nematostella vectensis]|uniref:uncharacterized protein LOC116610133 n=1 Tax=Nematostella vectensis TaxID=45351 RepID=UPI0020779A17|nr:uncharacterized protein LOC116610133 [Nematostella vectensis]